MNVLKSKAKGAASAARGGKDKAVGKVWLRVSQWDIRHCVAKNGDVVSCACVAAQAN